MTSRLRWEWPHGRARSRVLRAPLFSNLALVMLSALTPHAAQAMGCSKDTDCKGERICEAGKCVAPPVDTPSEPPVAPSSIPTTTSAPTTTAPTVTPATTAQGGGAAASAVAPPVSATVNQVEPGPTSPAFSPAASRPATALSGTSTTIGPAPIAVPRAQASEAPPAERKRSKAPLVFGIITLSTGYVIAVVSAITANAVGSQQTAQSGGTCVRGADLSLIPLIGPFLTLGQYPRHDVVGYNTSGATVYDCGVARGPVTALVVVDEVLQLSGAGLIALHIGLGASSRSKSVGSVEILPFAAGTPVGPTLRLRGL